MVEAQSSFSAGTHFHPKPYQTWTLNSWSTLYYKKIFSFYLSEIGSHLGWLTGLELSVWTGWPWAHRDLPSPASGCNERWVPTRWPFFFFLKYWILILEIQTCQKTDRSLALSLVFPQQNLHPKHCISNFIWVV